MKPLEALEDLRKDAKNHLDDHTKYLNDRLDIIEEELALLNALRIKLDRKIKTKEYIYEASNGYRIGTLLTYELKEQWDDIELKALKRFLLNISGISKELKALEIIIDNLGIKMRIDEEDIGCLYVPLHKDNICIVGYVQGKDKIDLLKEVLKND